MAHALCELNRQRQAVELEVFNQCLAMLAGRKQYDCLVLADKAWHQGVVGIVASRFNEFITSKLIAGAMDGLLRHNVREEDVDIAWVPGAFEAVSYTHLTLPTIA